MTTPDLDRAVQEIRSHAGDKAGEWPEKAAIAVIETLFLDPSEEVVEAAVKEWLSHMGASEEFMVAWRLLLVPRMHAALRAAGLHYLGRTG